MKKSFALLPLLLLSACAPDPAQQSVPTPAATRPVDFTLTRQTRPDPWAGFGACMNPYLYAYPNTREIDDESAKDLERKVIALHPQLVRIFLLLPWFHGQPDHFVSHDKDNHVDQSFIRTARLAQQAGADVNVTLWYGPWTHPEAQAAEFADVLADLIEKQHLTNIRYATIQNEVNDHEGKVTKAIYTRLYKSFDAELRKRNVRDHVKIVAGDLVYLHQDQWFAYMARDLNDIADAWSSHVYWDYTDSNKITRRLTDIRRDVDALPPGKRKPLQITEFGARGDRPDKRVEPGTLGKNGPPITETPLGAAQVNRFALEAVNNGFSATVQWDCYDAWYDRKMRYGLLGDVNERFRPKPGYWSLSLLTHTTPINSHPLIIQGAHPDATVAAFRTPQNTTTIYAQNNTDHPTTITLAGLPPDTTYQVQTWNATGYGTLATAPAAHPNPDSTLQLTLPPLALYALTNNR